MMTKTPQHRPSVKYSDFVDRIDYDALYADLDWEPNEITTHEDKGYCLMGQNHKNGDTTGKLAINRDKGVYNCFVCGGGSLLSLIMEVKNLDPHHASQYLYQFTKSDKINPADFYAKVARMLEQEPIESKVAPHFNSRILEKWATYHPWFAERGISQEVQEYFKCGFDPVGKRISKTGEVYEGPGIILPHIDGAGKVLGWQTRWLDTDLPRWVQKYTNTMDFPRERTVWGWDFAISQKAPPIIVESVTTALMLISEGYSAIATFGAQVTPAQLKLLRVFQKGVMLAPDNDTAGGLWFEKAIAYLPRYVPVLQVPYVEGPGADLGDLTPQELSLHLQSTRPWFEVDSHT